MILGGKKNEGRMIIEVGEGRLPVISFEPVGVITSGWLEKYLVHLYRSADQAQIKARHEEAMTQTKETKNVA